MKKKGSLNLELLFPVISSYKNRFWVSQNPSKFTVCSNAFLEQFKNDKDYKIIDAAGNLYHEYRIERLGYTNFFFGCTLGSTSSTYFANIFLEKIKEMSLQELTQVGIQIIRSNEKYFSGTMLDIERWEAEFVLLDKKDDVLRYMYYFADTSRYNNPDMKDLQWKERSGFVK
jgi:hypothetical protein